MNAYADTIVFACTHMQLHATACIRMLSCAKEPNIKANDVLALAKKMKCPSEEGKVMLNTKAKRLVWILQSFDTP